MSIVLKKYYNTLWLFGLLMLLLPGCGYTLVGQGSLPAHIKTMAIPTFENLTLEHGVEDALTQAMIDAYSRGGKVRLAPESSADAVLIGAVRSYNANEAIEFNDRNDPIKYRLSVTVDVELRDLTTGGSLWKTESMQETANFLGGPDYNLADESENRRDALAELAQELSRKVFALSTEGF
jgi:outer membrane lipopolysaccharide assembly protein LptE/RlpB